MLSDYCYLYYWLCKWEEVKVPLVIWSCLFFPGSRSVRTSLSSRIQKHNGIKNGVFITSRRLNVQHTFLVGFICSTTLVQMKNLFPLMWRKIYFCCVKRQICWMSFPGWVQSIHKVCSDFYRCVDKTRRIKLWNFFQVWGHSKKCCCMFQSKIESSLVYCSQLPNLKCKIGK